MEDLTGFKPVGSDQEEKEEKSVVKKLPSKNLLTTILPVFLGVLIVLAGVGTGWFLSGGLSAKSELQLKTKAVGGADQELGITDEETFRDSAEGTLEAGGINGEGTHHLVREGGESQYVYLTSTVIDLESFVGKKVQVWGETIGAQKAGWLMDVGRIKVFD
ncbi:hypothetical protein IID21_04730 [Patescibacteria group bacterium]|nr:hypothetical protein [Patescibacteria group bacterium]